VLAVVARPSSLAASSLFISPRQHQHGSFCSVAARLLVGAALIACNTVAPAQTSGPIAAYSFDAASGTTVADVTGRGNTLNLLNGTTWTTGHSGSALSFDGVNDVAVAAAYNSSLNLPGRSFTVSAWIYRRSNSGWQIIVDKPYGVGHVSPYFDWSLHVENSTGRIVAFLGCEGAQRVSNSSAPLNAWTHVAITYDGSAIRHYLNGALDRTTSVTCSVSNTNSRPIRIGANGAGSEGFNGRIDDVRIYNRPLSATEIQNDMSTPLSSSSGSGATNDTTAPTISVTAPASGATVSGTVSLAANAADNVGVAGVRFKVDGVNVGSEDLSAPYGVSWSTTQFANGSHSITATARDAAGNVKTSNVVTVSVNNGGSAAPTVTFSANPTSISSGNASTLSWNTSNASSCSASGAWSGSKATSGSQSTGTLTSPKTYTLTCTGSGGRTSRSVTVNVSATVPAPTLTLSASPTSVASGGSSSLTWSSTDASSCTASGAWSGSKATSGSAGTGSLTAASNTFTLSCSGSGGSASRSVTVTVADAAQAFGLDFPGSAATSGTIRFRFTNPLAIYPATYIWKVMPRQQNGYYTAFFWGNDGPFYWGPTSPDTYYGAHPYPSPPPNGSAHKWEISVYGDDYVSSQNVEYNRWHTQALRVWSDGAGKHHEFYWDLPDTSRVIRVDVPSGYGNIMPPSPALTFGDAPWNQSNEIMNGVMRGFQIYSVTLTLNDVLAEIKSPRSTSNGASHIWYLNLNPTPSDISDKSGSGHNPSWVGGERPRLWSGQ
jgi:hypothetical protein